ncbi:MAG: hypothetical protein WCA23_02125, partial [Stellaceae bacterium]
KGGCGSWKKLMPRVRSTRLARLAADRMRIDSTTGLESCTPRAWNTVCNLVREGLVQSGIDPEIATAVQLGGMAGHRAEFDDTLELERFEEELAVGDHDGLAGIFIVKIEDIARRFRDGHEPDFASASLAELFAWCVARRDSCRG